MRLAWYGAALERQKRLPDLKNLLIEKPPVQRQTGNDHVAALRMIGLKGHRTEH